MPKFIGDFYAMAPVWGEIEFDVDDAAQFEFEANNYVRDLHDGATEIDIRNIREVV